MTQFTNYSIWLALVTIADPGQKPLAALREINKNNGNFWCDGDLKAIAALIDLSTGASPLETITNAWAKVKANSKTSTSPNTDASALYPPDQICPTGAQLSRIAGLK